MVCVNYSLEADIIGDNSEETWGNTTALKSSHPQAGWGLGAEGDGQTPLRQTVVVWGGPGGVPDPAGLEELELCVCPQDSA